MSETLVFIHFEENAVLTEAHWRRVLALSNASDRVYLGVDFAAPPRLDEYRLPEMPKAPQPKDWYRRFEKRARA